MLNKHEKELNVTQADAKYYLNDYFVEKGIDFFHMHRKKRGFDTFNRENLLEFYLKLTQEELQKADLEFNSEEDFNIMLDLYFEKVEKI